MDVKVERPSVHRRPRRGAQVPAVPVWRDTSVPLDVRVEAFAAAASREGADGRG